MLFLGMLLHYDLPLTLETFAGEVNLKGLAHDLIQLIRLKVYNKYSKEHRFSFRSQR